MENIQKSSSGKTSPERTQVTKGWTSEPCLKRSQKVLFQCLNLEDGPQAEWFEGGQLTSHGEHPMPNIGESPSEERESNLLEILQEDAPRDYYLSATACRGILRRAENKGKELPPILKMALEQQAGISQTTD